jgi:putative SOS response-associated peptidase YedK
MCGRFAQSSSPEALARQFRIAGPQPAETRPSWNLAPSQLALVVRRNPETGFRHLDPLLWGLVPHWTKDFKSARRPINARAETVASSPMFSSAFKKRRCLVPADAWYEWKAAGRAKQPYAFAAHDRMPLAFAGLWESWTEPGMGKILRTFTILTTEANQIAATVHDRMPVIISPADWQLWLGEEEGNPAGLLHPASDELLESWPVSPAVGNIRNNGAALLQPIS